MPQAVERKRGDAIAGGRVVACADFRAMQQLLVVVTYEEESAVICVLELCEQNFCQFTRPVKVGGMKLCLHEFEQRIEQKRVIVEISIQAGFAILVAGEQPAVAPKIRADKICRAPRGPQPMGLAEDARRV